MEIKVGKVTIRRKCDRDSVEGMIKFLNDLVKEGKISKESADEMIRYLFRNKEKIKHMEEATLYALAYTLDKFNIDLEKFSGAFIQYRKDKVKVEITLKDGTKIIHPIRLNKL